MYQAVLACQAYIPEEDEEPQVSISIHVAHISSSLDGQESPPSKAKKATNGERQQLTGLSGKKSSAVAGKARAKATSAARKANGTFDKLPLLSYN